MQRHLRDLLLLRGRGSSIPWLLRDEFTDTLAAGAVNGTPATPGPGTRVVVDAGGDALSVAGGSAVYTNTNNNYGDPGLWLDSFARVVGRVLAGQITVNTRGSASFGWDSNQSGVWAQPYWWLGGTTFSIRLGGAALNSTAYSDSDVLKLFMITGTSGIYFLYDLNSAGIILAYPPLAHATDPVYPGLGSFSAIVDLDWIHIPDELYLPTPLAYDTFTRANGALGSSEAAGPDGQTAPVHAWNNRVGTTQIAGNVASASALVGGIAIATVDTAASVDTIVQGTLTRAGNEVGVVLRYVDADNYIRAVHDGVNCQLIKRVATAETTVITAAVAIGAGQIVVIPEGTSFSLYLNNAQVGTTQTVADGALQTGTEQGLFSTNVGNTQDAFLVMPRGTGGEYGGLDRYA